MDSYDPGEFPVVRFPNVPWCKAQSGDDDSLFGPIVICRRRRLTRAEVALVWERCRGRCHICKKKKWKLAEHGRYGWHVDHHIPNVGGGRDTEAMENFKVACAKCNLKKGRGHTPRTIGKALEPLLRS